MTVAGVRVEYKANERLSILGAWTAGESTSFENTFDDNGFLFQVRFKPTKTTTFKYSFFLEANNGLNKRPDAAIRFGRDCDTQDSYSHHVVVTWDVTPRWQYMIEGYAAVHYGKRDGEKEKNFANGVNQSLIYKINDRWSVGGRFEWLKARNTLFDLAYLTDGAGTDICSLALAVNWWPSPRFNIRPELRYDWTDYKNGFGPFGGGTEKNQLTGGFAVTLKF